MSCYICGHSKHEGGCRTHDYCTCFIYSDVQPQGLDVQILGVELV